MNYLGRATENALPRLAESSCDHFMHVCAGPELHHLLGFLGQGRKPMTGTPVVHVVVDNASVERRSRDC
jgi:hypothetical protein